MTTQQINHHDQDETNLYIPVGKYLDKVDRVMTQVDRITEDIAHMPVAAFIFRDKKSDEIQYSSDVRYLKNSELVKLNMS